jgi:hypothetical protein
MMSHVHLLLVVKVMVLNLAVTGLFISLVVLGTVCLSGMLLFLPRSLMLITVVEDLVCLTGTRRRMSGSDDEKS